MRQRLALKWLRLLGLVWLLPAAPARATMGSEIPFKLRDGLIWIRVDGSGSGKPLIFLLDSGAEASVIDLQAAQRLKLAVGETVNVRGISATTSGYWTAFSPSRLGGVALATKYLAMDLSAVGAACHRQVDGLIGADFFAGRVVQIDFANGKIRLLEQSPVVAKAEILPLQIEGARLRVPVEVVGLGKAWTRLDSGCASALHWVVSQSDLAGQDSEELGVGVSSMLIRENSQSVRLGRITLDHISTGMHTEKLLAGESGLLGAGLLSHFASVTIDQPDRQVILENYVSPKPASRR